MNILSELTKRITERSLENKNPCKLYTTYEAADKAGAAISEECGNLFDINGNSARYVVGAFNGKYFAAVDMTELMGRSSFCGGYIMHAGSKGFYTF